MSNYIGATHNQIEGSTLHGGQHWSTVIHYHGDGSQDSHDRERSREVLKPLVTTLETNSFLDLLLPMTDHVENISKTSSIDPDDPKLYWILRNADFKIWESADNSQVLWLFGGPPGYSMTGVSSFIAKQEASRRNDEVFYFSCSKEGSDAITTFTHSVLRHILNGSEPRPAKSIIQTFLSTLLFKIIQRDRSRFKEGRSSVITMEEILKAEGGGLLEALTEAVVEMTTIPDTPIVIDGIDKIGLDGSRFLTRFCSNSTVSPKPKVLLTCRLDPDIKEIIVGVPCIIIEYDKERQECLNSLRHHATRYDKIETEHHDTLKWLWEHEQYRAWSSTSHSDLLLIEGKPGSGKSTLTKYFKDNLLERESPAKQAIVGSFFYSYRDGKLQRDHSNMLRSILYDVLHQNETFFFHFQTLYRKMLQHGAWSYDSLKEILLSFKEHPVKERLYLIIDAIDESDTTDRCDIIQLLHQICTTKKLCIVKVFIASRPITWLSHRVPDIKNIIKLQDENEPDILKFTESFLDEELKLSTTSHKDIKDFIMHNARGVFVWVRLVQMELLKYHATGFRNQDINAFLHSLPKELDEFYERMLRELEDKYEQRDVNDGVRMFQLVLFAYRPLRIAEIQQALAIPDDFDAEYSPSDTSFEDGLIDDIVKRIICCGGNFLDIRGNDILQFTHQTALTFFSRLLEPTATSKFRMNEDDAHRRISITCIRYLMLCVARSTSENEPPITKSWEPAHFEKYAEYLNRRPLIDYALCHFQQHKNDCILRLKKRKNDCHRCVFDELLVSQLSKQLTSNSASLLFESWIKSYLGAKGFRKNMHHTARIVRLRIESWIDSRRGRGVAAKERRPPAADFRNNMLHTATRMQYSRVVEALLSAGTEKEACLLDKTPLLMSAEAGDVATSEVLLRKGARIDAKDNKEQTALLLAAAKGHDTMVSLLVNSGANKEESDGNGRTALHNAAVSGHDSTVLLLVKTLGTDKEAKDKKEWTALHHAASNGHDSTVQLLVETLGADKEAKDEKEWTALHHAASNGHDSTVQLLVETLGTDKEAKDYNECTALHHAASNGHDSTVRRLVETLGADIGAKDCAGSTLLHTAAIGGHDNTVRLLSTLGASTEVEDSAKRTALHLAAIFGRKGTVKLLVNELQANREAEDGRKHTALHFAAVLGHESTVQLLVNILYVNKDAKNLEGKTALDITREFHRLNDRRNK